MTAADGHVGSLHDADRGRFFYTRCSCGWNSIAYQRTEPARGALAAHQRLVELIELDDLDAVDEPLEDQEPYFGQRPLGPIARRWVGDE